MNTLALKRLKDESQSVLLKLKNGNEVGNRKILKLLENTYTLVSSEDNEYYNQGLKNICYIANQRYEDLMIKQVLHDCIIQSRVFLYEDMIQKHNIQYSDEIKMTLIDAISKELYTLETDTVLTRDQRKLLDDFVEYKRIIISAPTSFGKSRIIPEIIVKMKYKIIAIILPTVALLAETYHRFIQNQYLTEYNIINSLQQELIDGKNIMIFTPEKMDMFMDNHENLNIDFFVMDEIYKIQGDDDRSKIFIHVLYRLTKKCDNFYLIGPYFNKFSIKFIEKNNAFFRKFSAEIVQKEILSFDNEKNELQLPNYQLKRIKDKGLMLDRIINRIKGQNLIYCKNQSSAETRAKRIAKVTEKIGVIDEEFIDYIVQNISSEWSLIQYLRKGVAFHHGGLPKYIKKEIVDSYNDNKITNLVCTTSLIEGVNTSAKNVIVYDNHKANIPLTGFEIKNIEGRAGRFTEHFIGYVIFLEDKILGEEISTIEFEYFDNDQLGAEECIQVEKKDLEGNNLNTRKQIEEELIKHNIPFSILKKNKFISIIQQINLFKYFRNNENVLEELYFESNLPKKAQLNRIMDICYDYLFNEKDRNDRGIYFTDLKVKLNYYVYKNPSLKQLISGFTSTNEDTRIRNTFKLISRYFEFSLPRYFAVFENIYNYVYYEKFNKYDAISMSFVITKLQFGFSEEHEIALKDIGVPRGIVKKVSKLFSDCKNITDIRMKLKLNPYLLNNVLTSFEKRMFLKYV